MQQSRCQFDDIFYWESNWSKDRLHANYKHEHFAKSVQIRSFFWSVFSVFGLNTDIYAVNLRIQSECGKIRTRQNSIFGHFIRSGNYTGEVITGLLLFYVYCKNRDLHQKYKVTMTLQMSLCKSGITVKLSNL